jgi:hypothetical protein
MTEDMPIGARTPRWVILAAAILAAASTVRAQRSSVPPIRQLGATVARAKDSIGNVFQLLQLPDGRVVVNDNLWQRLTILDSSLAHPIVVLDTANTAKRLYPASGGTPLRYRGDSILFADPISHAFLVIDGAGTIVRDIAFPPGPMPRVLNSFHYFNSFHYCRRGTS